MEIDHDGDEFHLFSKGPFSTSNIAFLMIKPSGFSAILSVWHEGQLEDVEIEI